MAKNKGQKLLSGTRDQIVKDLQRVRQSAALPGIKR